MLAPGGGVLAATRVTLSVARLARVRIAMRLVACCAPLALVLTGTGSARAAGWTVERAPQPASWTGAELDAVSCASRTACVAVGYDRPGNIPGRPNATVPLIERFDGAGWRVERSPTLVDSALDGVSCASRTVCVAVGWHAGGLLAERFDGQRWSIQRIATPGDMNPRLANQLTAVSCPSRTICVAVGAFNDSSRMLIERFNGQRSSIQLNANGGELDDVSCASQNACVTVGMTDVNSVAVAERFDGQRWTRQSVPQPTNLTIPAEFDGVSCTAADACIAVGSWAGPCDGCEQLALAERFDGIRWRIVNVRNPGMDNALLSVSCTSADACVAVGGEVTDGSTALPLAERWNGIGWSAQAIPNPAVSVSGLPPCVNAGSEDSIADCGDFIDVSCVSATVCTAVGLYTDPAPVPLIARRS